MNTPISVLLAMCVSSHLAADLTLDPELYQDALRQVQGGESLIVAKRAPEQLARLWEEAMMPARDATASPASKEEARLARQLRLTFLFKELNPALSFSSMQELIRLHERALSGDLSAQATIIQSLCQGMDTQQRRWPQSQACAERWLRYSAALK